VTYIHLSVASSRISQKAAAIVWREQLKSLTGLGQLLSVTNGRYGAPQIYVNGIPDTWPLWTPAWCPLQPLKMKTS